MLARLFAALLSLAAVIAATPTRAETRLETLARRETIALIRHANAPGVGDPAEMRIGDCATQRNLDAAGRAEAQALGATLREAGILRARILSSRWCRTIETADLLAVGNVAADRVLDSFFGARHLEAERTAALVAFIAGLPDDMPIILVTHQVNITALTGIVPAPAEIVLVDRRAPHVVRTRLR